MTALKLCKGALVFATSPSEVAEIPRECLERSALLQDLLVDTEVNTEIPLAPAALQLWISHAGKHAGNSSMGQDGPAASDAALSQRQSSEHISDGDVTRSACKGLGIQEACLLLTAADVLVDKHTKIFCARSISTMMVQRPPGSESAISQAVAALPEHLQLTILSLTPLPHCLSLLPPSWHPLALRAHHPSIDTHATLALHRLPIASVHTALSAAATLTTLRALSLAGLTFPLDCAPCISLLGALKALTALDLHDIGLRQQSADALAAVLPMLRQLESLNLSCNHITEPVMQALAPALRQCTAMRSLNLWRTLSLSATDGNGLEVLGFSPIEPMQQLTSVALGVYTCRPVGDCAGAPTCRQCSGLMTTLSRLTSTLVNLRLDLFSCEDDNDHAPDVLGSISLYTQLQSLHLTVPPMRSRNISPLFSAHRPHAQLTSLHLDFIPGARNAVPVANAQLSSLASLPQLQQLWLRVPSASESSRMPDPFKVLGQVLAGMSCLSHLQLRVAPGGPRGRLPVRADGAPGLADAVEAALSLPQLKVLHAPVLPMHGGHERLVQPLVQAAQRGLQLTVALQLHLRLEVASVQPEIGTFAPLFPYAESLEFLGARARDAIVLAPVFAQVSAFVSLRKLRFFAVLKPDEPETSTLTTLLNQVSCLSRLETLQVHLSHEFKLISLCSDDADWDVKLGGFLAGLRSLSGLTQLSFDLYHMGTAFQQALLRTCKCLPHLQELDLGEFRDWEREVCGEVLPQLRLTVLHLVMYPPYMPVSELARSSRGMSEREALDMLGQMVAGVFRRLEHLRCLVTREVGAGDSWTMRQVTAELPAFQMYGVAERPAGPL